MELRLRINEAIARANDIGLAVSKKAIAARLWPESDEVCRKANMTGLCTGKRKSIRVEWIAVICEMCHCSPNYLFTFNE